MITHQLHEMLSGTQE